MQPKVIIISAIYNQEQYIEQTLQSLVMQKTDFPFVVYAHDDCSTDNTKNIILKYQELYPEIIIPKFHEKNCFSQGPEVLQKELHKDLTSEYVAVCDGDDYWTDEYKLQKQVDFLDTHPDFSLCCHPVELKWEEGKNRIDFFPEPVVYENKTEFILEELLKRNFIPTSSVCYRWRKDFNEVFPLGIFPGDWFKHLLHAEKGKIKIIPEVMGVYRKHSGGVWDGEFEGKDSFYLRNGFRFLNFYKLASKRFHHDYTQQIKWEMAKTLLAFLNAGQFEQIVKLAELDKTIFGTVIAECKNIPQLHSHINYIENANKEMWAANQSLQQAYGNLENGYQSLQQAYGNLENGYQSLQQAYDNLENSYQSLQQSYDNLENSYHTLENGYQSLQQEYKKEKQKKTKQIHLLVYGLIVLLAFLFYLLYVK